MIPYIVSPDSFHHSTRFITIPLWGHQLECINPFAYPEKRSTTAEARQTMVDLVQHSSAPVSSIATTLNTTYGLSLLGRDVYNRTYQYTQRTGNSTAKFVETLRDEGFIYRIKMASDCSLEALFFCKPEDMGRFIRKHMNFGNSTTSRVEGSRGALKGALTSSSGTLLTAGKKINHRARDQSEQSSIIGSNQNLHVSLEIRNQVETANLCTAISRSALELVYAS
ncbi:hypothetical protein V1509DRAFT_652015 [Lipomyces kononenkoae]